MLSLLNQLSTIAPRLATIVSYRTLGSQCFLLEIHVSPFVVSEKSSSAALRQHTAFAIHLVLSSPYQERKTFMTTGINTS